MHIGSIRQVLYNYLWAGKHNGSFVLRIEDTDLERSVDGGVDSIYETLEAFGIDVDEGPKQGGPFAPYIQSERLDIYKEHAEELIDNGAAYHCFCTRERLEKMREEQIGKKQQPKYDGLCRGIPLAKARERIANGEQYVVRLKVPETGYTEYDDVIHGKIRFKNSLIDDQILLKSDGYPTYHFAAVVDDHLMKISHVIRGEEYVSSAPKVVLMYNAFGWEMPYLVQTPNVLDPDGRKKLSKRGGANTAHKFLRKGYLVEALWNFLVLLGWAPTGSEGKESEIYSKEELLELFDLRRIKKAGARFLPDKLEHFNGEYIRGFPVETFAERIFEWADSYVLHEFIADTVVPMEEWERSLVRSVKTYLPQWKEDESFNEKLLLIQERVKYLSEVPDLLKFFYDEHLDYEGTEFDTLGHDDLADVLEGLWKGLSPVVKKEWKQESWEAAIRSHADTLGWKHGDLFMLLRLAMTGKRTSPPLFECMTLMGFEQCDRRVADAVNFLRE
jgi:glutamyl-tRNA synthetase